MSSIILILLGFALCSMTVSSYRINHSSILSNIKNNQVKFRSNVNIPSTTKCREGKITSLDAILPGDPMVSGTVSLGLVNAISLYSNILLAR